MERCSSSTSYMDYHRHSMAGNNFCYPYSPGMMRNGGSPYPMGGVGSAAPRYGMADYRSGGYYGEGGFDKYYGGGGGGYHAGYGANYYGNGYASYRDFGYNDYYQGSAFAGHHGAGGYHGPAGSSSHLYGGRQSLPLAFQRESYYHHQRDHPHGSPYGFGGNYSGNPYKAESSSTTPNSTNSGDAALFGGAPNGNSFQHSPDYPYGSSGDSPGGPEGSGSRGSGGAPGYPTSPSSSAMPNATGFPLSIKDARMRKLKERKLAKSSSSYSPSGGGGSSTCSSPNPVGSNGTGSGGVQPGATNGGHRLNALGPDTFEHHERPGKSSPSSRHPSPGRAATGGGSPPKRSKKQTSAKHGRGSSAAATADNDKSGDHAAAAPAMATPDKIVTPLPGFQQAFGSTEIGKFSEAFFNSSPGPTASDMLGHQHPDGAGHHNHHHPHHQLMMDSLAAATGGESDVETLSPQPWEPTGPGDPFHEPGGSSTYNLQIGTSFHPSYYESSSAAYTDHAADSPLGNYFSEMTCADQYVT